MWIIGSFINYYYSFSLSCSVACCKIHKETCQVPCSSEDQVSSSDTSTVSSEVSSAPLPSSLSDKIKASTRLSTFLSANPYLFEQLPVLLARIDHRFANETASNNGGNNNKNKQGNELARELERKQIIVDVLKETISVDPKISELFTILQDENLI
jgi:hypothetical protein